ncbi:hypothetical protein HHL24_42835 [Paraburkholderia sp. RP-4-7]|uniref:DNA helicase n=1 Tax=Paraburkholderia polaris TaxID=2728848 RepID=A0A848ITY4_9BURK|nr:hypothetical protein [Paraburkholderia polaris]NMM04556.1 hypothetical protein [Paraburkholderia polaris]
MGLAPSVFHSYDTDNQSHSRADDGLDTVDVGDTVKVKTYAGPGKTSTLRLIAERFERKRGQYLAFNCDIAADAKRKFPRNGSCRTVHSVAFAQADSAITARLNLPKEAQHLIAGQYGLSPIRVPTIFGKNVELSAFQVGRLVAEGSARFWRSAHA